MHPEYVPVSVDSIWKDSIRTEGGMAGRALSRDMGRK